MGRKLSIILATMVTFMIVSVVILFVLEFTQNRINKADETEIKNFVLINKSYTDSTGILIIDLQNVGDPLHSISKEDFTWYMDDQGMRPVYSITFPNGESTKVEKGDIIQVSLEIGKNSSGAEITLTIRGGPHIVITVP